MAEAMAVGLTKKNLDWGLQVYDVHTQSCQRFAKRFGATPCESPLEAVAGCDFVLLAVKPQNLEDVGKVLSGHISNETTVISILAGKTLDSVAKVR